MALLTPRGERIHLEESDEWKVVPTFLCKCGWIGALNDGGQVFCDNRKCENYGKLFVIRVSVQEVKVVPA